jgi:pyruvate dehydrogenase E1 component alpha subunit
MHLTSVAHHMMGSYATVGAHLCIANGTAWSARLRGTGQVTVCFFGDGATNTGAFHEALNMAKVWNLAVVFVCENNLYMEYTPIDAASAVSRPAADRAGAYGLPSLVIDGNDADAVYWAATEVIARARRGEGPSLVEAVTYRQGGHNPADLGQYRPAEEVQAWLTRDPIPVYHQRLLRLGVSEERLATMVGEVSRRVEDATEFAKGGLRPGEESLSVDLFADGGSAWRN